MNPHPKLRPAGFTLVELIVTITIIILLAGMVVGGFGYVRDKQALEKAKLQVALLSRGIDEYKLDMGVHPGEAAGTANSAGGDHSEVLYQALFYEGWDYISNPPDPDDLDPNVATTIYVAELDPSNSAQGWLNPSTSTTPTPNQKIIDPWANNYLYRIGSNAMNPDFDLWTPGKNGTTIPGGVGDPYDPTVTENRDDIRNF